MSAKMSPLRRRMIEDMRIRGVGDAQRRSHIRGVALFATFLGRSPDTATRSSTLPARIFGYPDR